MMRTKRLVLSEPAKAVRRKIELLDQRIDLPIARKALGLLEETILRTDVLAQVILLTYTRGSQEMKLA